MKTVNTTHLLLKVYSCEEKASMLSFFIFRPRITGFTLGKSYIRATDATLFGLNTSDICCGVANGLAFFEVLDIDMIVDELQNGNSGVLSDYQPFWC